MPASFLTSPLLRVIALTVGTAITASAQTATRSAADAPSTNAATRTQHDSLTVHFLRHPKGKPAVRAAGGASGAARGTAAWKRDTVEHPARPATPLPTRDARTRSKP